MRQFDAPSPSQWTPHGKVEEVAARVKHFYREASGHASGYPVNVLDFADLHLSASILWEEVEEPPFANVFAKCSRTGERYKIFINERHRRLFESRPDILRSCVGHEIGHCVLLHHHYWRDDQTPTLFDKASDEPRFLHDTSWHQYGASRKELEQLLSKTAALDPQTRQMLAELKDRFELEWMFRQAEHFSMCFLLPRDRLFECLEEGTDLCRWACLYRLAERFGVSISMLCTRLRKLGLIDVWPDKRITAGPALLQSALFSKRGTNAPQ